MHNMSHVIHTGWMWTAPAWKERAMITGLLRDIGNKPICAFNLPNLGSTSYGVHYDTPLIGAVKCVIHCIYSYLRVQRAWRVGAPKIGVELRSSVLGLCKANFQL